jgi:TM2 domain-containing membrane protein YozV
MFCSNCGKEIDDKAVVCVHCGVPVSNKNSSVYNGNAKSKLVAGILGILLGSFGVHNFYLGYNSKAIAQLVLTVVGWIIIIGPIISGIWGLIEGIMILIGSIDKDAQGNLLKD